MSARVRCLVCLGVLCVILCVQAAYGCTSLFLCVFFFCTFYRVEIFEGKRDRDTSEEIMFVLVIEKYFVNERGDGRNNRESE